MTFFFDETVLAAQCTVGAEGREGKRRKMAVKTFPLFLFLETKFFRRALEE